MTIVCPKCGAELELRKEMVNEVIKCGYCKTAFVASEWSGVLLTEDELARYEVDHSNEKLAKKFGRYLSPYEGNSYGGGHGLFSASGVSSMYFPTEVAGAACGGFEPSQKHPYLGVYIIARMEQDWQKGYPGHTAEIQRLIEAAIGFRVEKTYDETCSGANGSLRCYVWYFVHTDKPCQRMGLPESKTQVAEREYPVDEWTRVRDFEYSRAYDLIFGNEVERFYSSCCVDFLKELKDRCNFGWLQLVRVDRDWSGGDKTPSGVQIRIDTAVGELVLPEGLVGAIEQRLGRKLSLIDVDNSGDKNTYIFAMETPNARSQSVEQKSGLKTVKGQARQARIKELPSFPDNHLFSTGRKNKYRINDSNNVDVSGKGFLGGLISSFFAGLRGKGIVTKWDKIN